MGNSEVNGDVEVIFTAWPWDAVARGVALLDEKVPGWRMEVVPGDLDMGDCDDCVLGQVYGWYEEGLTALGFVGRERINPQITGHFGFTLPHTSPDMAGDFQRLADAWREAIAGGSK